MYHSKEPFVPGGYYHIFNKAVGNELLYYSDNNYLFFLERFKKYINPIASTLSYCLMPNHFHFLIQINNSNGPGDFNFDHDIFSNSISKQFSHLFNSYSQAINKQQNRSGSLFKNRFKRIAVEGEKYLRQLVLYIHMNPVKNNYCSTAAEWKFSSFNSIFSNFKSDLERSQVSDLFENEENYFYCHQQFQCDLESKKYFE